MLLRATSRRGYLAAVWFKASASLLRAALGSGVTQAFIKLGEASGPAVCPSWCSGAGA